MSMIRTFYWHERVRKPFQVYFRRHIRRKLWTDFVHGNAGDIYARDLLAHFYPEAKSSNCDTGPRILSVGSIGHKLQAGDVLCGIGCKWPELPTKDSASVYVHALRGPISYDAFKSAGYDVSNVKFLADPGLLISQMVPERAAKKGKVVFIPHYRERKKTMAILPKGIEFVDIDNSPIAIAQKIQSAECVYASSLHAIIFAHALGRPCVFVRPATEEPMLKYEDYYGAIGLDMPVPLSSIADADLASAPVSPAQLSVSPQDIVFPSAQMLRERGVIT